MFEQCGKKLPTSPHAHVLPLSSADEQSNIVRFAKYLTKEGSTLPQGQKSFYTFGERLVVVVVNLEVDTSVSTTRQLSHSRGLLSAWQAPSATKNTLSLIL